MLHDTIFYVLPSKSEDGNLNGQGPKHACLIAKGHVYNKPTKEETEIYTTSLDLLEIGRQNSCNISPETTMLIWPSIEKLQKPDEQ